MSALIEASEDPNYPAEVALVISNRVDSPGLKIAQAANIPTNVILHQEFESRVSFDAAITKEMEANNIQLICLAGFMRLLSKEFCQRWSNKLINIHQSLLQAFKGLEVHQRMLESGVRIAGCTVHFVRPAMDEGPILVQAAVPIASNDTPETLSERILQQEHRIYPFAVRLIAEGRVNITDQIETIDNYVLPEDSLINPPPS